jgi:Subtilase family
MAWYDDSEQPRARAEAGIIVGAFDPIKIDGVLTDDGWIEYMYAEDQLLVRQPYLEPVRAVLGDRGSLSEPDQVVRGIDLVEVHFDDDARNRAAAEDDEAGRRRRPMLIRLLDDIDATLGPGVATPNHVLTTSNGSPAGCPATEPQETYDRKPFPAPCPPGTGGDGVRIWVADTGFEADTATVSGCDWLTGVTGDGDPSVTWDGPILRYGGHGTFVAGVIRAMAPGAHIVVKCVFDKAGSALESDFVPKLYQGFGFGADIFHITVASQTRRNLPLVAFETWLADLRSHKGVVCIVPAGNNDTRQPCWPAAFPGIISVGALATDWRSRAYFSNFGGWVDVYAPGENLVNAFPKGTFTCKIPPYEGQKRTFRRLAQWSGTSFSTPIVTGLIAARMTRCGESAPEAAEALLARARTQVIPGAGPALFPECDGDDERCGRCSSGRGTGDCGRWGCRCGSGCGCDGCGNCDDGCDRGSRRRRGRMQRLALLGSYGSATVDQTRLPDRGIGTSALRRWPVGRVVNRVHLPQSRYRAPRHEHGGPAVPVIGDFGPRQSQRWSTGTRILDVPLGGVGETLGLGLEDEPLDGVGDREVQGQRRRAQAGQ